MNLKNFFNLLPTYPHYKMNVFSGTNKLQEIIGTLKCLYSSVCVKGPDIDLYHRLLREKLATHCYSFASGRMGFYSILKSMNIQPNDEIIIPSFTCVVVPNAILYSGAKPVYCDISSYDFNIDINKLESLITPRTRIIYAQHTFGQMCNMEVIGKIALKYNLIVIEDAALALGAKFNGQWGGTIGDFGYFSTDRSKVINTGLGGIVTVNNHDYLKKFSDYYNTLPYLDEKLTRNIAKTFLLNIITLHPYFYWIGKFINAVLTKFGFMTYLLDEKFTRLESIQGYPYPAKLSNICARIGISQFQNIEENIKHRKRIAHYYNEILKIYPYEYIEDEKNIFLRYSFLINNREYWEERFSSKIDLSIWFKTIASGKSENFGEIGYLSGSNTVSEHVCSHIFNLPTHQQIKPEKLRNLLIELKLSGDIIERKRNTIS